MAFPFGFGKKQEPEPGEPRELSPEEQLLAEKAKAAQQEHDAERRGQAQDVSDFLGEILREGPPEPPPEGAPPAVSPAASGEPKAPGPAAPSAPSEAAAARRTLSAPLAAAWSQVMALGRSGEGPLGLEFEPEAPAAAFDRMVANLSARRRRQRPRLEFEPEAAGLRPAYSLADLPEMPFAPAPPGTEPGERLTDIEPAMEEDGLDDAGLRQALAAAETEGGRLEAGGGRLRPAVSGPQSAVAGSPAGSPRPPAAEHAADLSVQQLAEVERRIEGQIPPVKQRPAAPGPEAAPKRAGRARPLASLLAALRRSLGRRQRSADRALEPYGLSCKRLLGVAGILIWAVLIAYVLKTWILPRMHGGA